MLFQDLLAWKNEKNNGASIIYDRRDRKKKSKFVMNIRIQNSPASLQIMLHSDDLCLSYQLFISTT